jgi:thioredoxin reductase
MLSGQLQVDTARRLGWTQRTVLSIASPLLAQIRKPSTIRRLSRYWMPVGKTVAVIGSDFVACEVADFLSHSGRKAIVLANKADIATEMAIPARWKLLESLRASGVDVITGVALKQISSDGVVIAHKEGKVQTVKADSVILTEEIGPNPDLIQTIEGKVSVIYSAGDCRGLGLIEGAIADGLDVGSKV